MRDIFDQWQKAVQLDMGQEFVIPPERKGGTMIQYLAAGATAGVISRTCTAPLDRIKIIFQTQQSSQKFSGIIQSLQKITMEEGSRGLWRGNFANVIKIIPESGIRFLCYENYKKALVGDAEEVTPVEKFIAGGMAGITTQACIYPLELVRSRLAVSRPDTYKGMKEVIEKTYQSNGIRGFYRGLVPSLIGIMPYAAVDLAVYDVLKTLYASRMQHDPGVLTLLCCGAISSTSGQLVSYPLDLVRRRLQVQGIAGYGRLEEYSGGMDVLRKVYTKEGFFGLYKGMTPNMCKVVPAVSISYVVYEQMKKVMDIS